MKVLALLTGLLLSAPSFASPCQGAGKFVVQNGSVQLHAAVTGRGPGVLMIPSLGRGGADFEALAKAVAKAGFAAITFEPRWFGASDGPEAATLFDLADDAAAVARKACPNQPVTVIGHAFGNRVARAMASRHEQQVHTIVLLAAGGKSTIPPDVLAAISGAASQGIRPDEQRLGDLRLAFFAKGNDPAVWLDGWSPRAADLQSKASRATKVDDWWGAGRAPVLVVQAVDDPVSPVSNGEDLRARAPDRVTLLRLEHASHAMLPEQPKALAKSVVKWLRGERRAARLQSSLDRHLVRR